MEKFTRATTMLMTTMLMTTMLMTDDDDDKDGDGDAEAEEKVEEEEDKAQTKQFVSADQTVCQRCKRQALTNCKRT